MKAIHDKAGEVTTENVLDWIGPTYQLEKELKNPLHTDHHFYLSEDSCQSYAEPSAELMEMVCSLPALTSTSVESSTSTSNSKRTNGEGHPLPFLLTI